MSAVTRFAPSPTGYLHLGHAYSALFAARAAGDDGRFLLRIEDIEARIDELGDELALVMFGGVNFRTGQVLEMERITRAAHDAGRDEGDGVRAGVGF